MKKATTLLLLAACLAFSAPVATASSDGDLTAFPVKGQAVTAPGTEVGAMQLRVPSDGAVLPGLSQTAKTPRKAPAKAVSMSALVGKGVMTYKTISSSTPDGGLSVEVAQLGTDSVTITNFYNAGVVVKAKVDLSAGTIEIPSQYVGTTTDGECDIAVSTIVGKPVRTEVITGTISADGTISIPGYWGFFINSGSKKDRYVTINEKTIIERANASMDVTYYNGEKDAESWNVIVKKTGTNVVTVKNLGNHGCTAEIVLNADKSLRVLSQKVWTAGTTMGNFYTLAADWVKGGATTSAITGTGTDNQLTWGNWIMYSTTKYYTGKLASAKIYGDGITFTYPDNKQTAFEGEGTEANPYKIKTLDDLVTLATNVNSDDNYVYGDPSLTMYASTYRGKYFSLENDIDMTGYRFEPIGNYYTQRFGGTFDGKGHTLKSLDVNTRGAGFAGLFGVADTVSVIKNLNVTNATVSGSYYYAGIVASCSFGLIENCNTSGEVTNEGVCAGGICGYAFNVKNCYFNGMVYGLGGMGGGIAGQSSAVVENCHARAGVYVSAPTTGYNGGGLVGTLYSPASALRNSYFTGIVDGRKHADMYVGGVVGNNAGGTVESCFAAADVYGYNSNAAVGGVAGVNRGTITDCYFTGFASCYNSNYVGGITGKVSPYIVALDTVQPTIKNCYFAGRTSCNTYLYDTENGVREALGTIESGCSPTIENVYFDKQMVNYSSKRLVAVTSDLTSASGPKGFSSSKWTFAEGYYPRIKGTEDTPEAQLSATVLAFDAQFPDNVERVANDFAIRSLGSTAAYSLQTINGSQRLSKTGLMGTIADGAYKLNGKFGNDTIAIVALNADGSMNASIQPRIVNIKVAPKVFEGVGTAESPYLIQNKADLVKLSQVTTKSRQFYKDTYFLQTADIDLENDTAFAGICCNVELTDKFQGHYDGGNHTIHNMKLDFVQWSVKPTETTLGTLDSKASGDIYKGFIGNLAPMGSLKNLTIAADCSLQFAGYSGAFVGYNYGTVDNCRNYADVTVYRTTAGGIVGASVEGSSVTNCFNAGHVRCGSETTGGIVADAQGIVANCQNVGTVEVCVLSKFKTATAQLRTAGGIAGKALGATISNVVNAGTVKVGVGADAAGGLIGANNSAGAAKSHNTITSAVNYGTVFCTKLAAMGAVSGKSGNAGNVEAVYYDAQVTGLNAEANDANPKMKGLSTSDLTSGKAVEGLSTDVWKFEAGKYPVLAQFASEPRSQAASQVVLSIPANQDARHISSAASLSSVDGTTWTLAQGKQFAIDNATLAVPAVTKTTTDTLTASLNGYVKQIPLVAVYALALEGDGTEANPFQISTVNDWNTFGSYISETANPLTGQYVKLMNDIDFSAATFKSAAADGITPFGGVFLGNKCSLKGLKIATSTRNYGVFGSLGTSAQVSDLTLEGTLTSTTTYAGAFAGYSNGALVNCTNRVNVSAKGYQGGFVAKIGGNASFDHCVNYATVTSTAGSVGAFAGESAAEGARFTDCTNEGAVTSSGTGANVGGFVGSGYSSQFVRCVNKADVSNAKGTATAGLMGYVRGTSELTITDCANEGTVTAADLAAGLVANVTATVPLHVSSSHNTGDISTSLSKSTHGTGGLLGMLSAGSIIEDCYNEGYVLSEKSVYTGGIWGNQLTIKSDNPAHVARCHNTGAIIGANYAGGIGGYLPNYTIVDSCYNTGDISASLGAGGIIGGLLGDGSTIRNSWNAGEITTVNNGAGGINGYGSGNSRVENSFNTGSVVAGTANAGGLGGQGRIQYYNCYNTGMVKATKAVGGLIGSPSSGTSTWQGAALVDCYNAGLVVKVDTLCGSLVGDNTGWRVDQGSVMRNTYYVTDYGTYAQDTIGGTAVTIAQLAALTDIEGNWATGDSYSFPVIPGFTDNDCARANAAAVVLPAEYTYDDVRGNFNVGTPSGVTWTVSDPVVEIKGNDAYVTDRSTAEVSLTATCGNFSRQWTVKLNSASGIDGVDADKAIVGVTYFNVGGMEVTAPANHDGQTYIVVRRYSDGSVKAQKMIDK